MMRLHLYIQTGCNQRVSKHHETADLVTNRISNQHQITFQEWILQYFLL